jgi:hypothetical protein
MKLQVDVNVENQTDAMIALDDVMSNVQEGVTIGDVYLEEGEAIGRFEILGGEEAC